MGKQWSKINPSNFRSNKYISVEIFTTVLGKWIKARQNNDIYFILSFLVERKGAKDPKRMVIMSEGWLHNSYS